MATVHAITFVELPNFTRHLRTYLTDDSYRELQLYLMQRPDAGDVVSGSGGCRKVRWAAEGRGKRGGVRVVYYYRRIISEIWMLTIYSKGEIANVPGHVLRQLREEIDRG